MKLVVLLITMTATSCRAPFGPVVNHADEIGGNPPAFIFNPSE